MAEVLRTAAVAFEALSFFVVVERGFFCEAGALAAEYGVGFLIWGFGQEMAFGLFGAVAQVLALALWCALAFDFCFLLGEN